VIDTLIFDFDGVIIDTETPDFDTWQKAFQDYGVELERTWWTGFIGGSSRRMDVCGLLEELTGREFDRDSLMRERSRRYLAVIESNPLLPGVVEFIHEAHRLGLKLAVASSSSHAWVDGHLESRGLRQHFDSVICSDDVLRVKPDPELYLLTASTLRTTPGNTLVIEDSANGVVAAKDAGAFCIAVPNPMTSDLPLGRADVRLNALSDMLLTDLLVKANGG
jgi:HAD superfamily hydrolase (TIGR01509 family)